MMTASLRQLDDVSTNTSAEYMYVSEALRSDVYRFVLVRRVRVLKYDVAAL